jgi:hypothetical protein
MEKGGTRLFHAEEKQNDHNWNIVELESHRELRRTINDLIQRCNSNTVNTSELLQQLHTYAASFGSRFSLHLARSVQRDNQLDRQSIVWLLTLLNNKETIPILQHIARQQRLPRAIRLSASLALAGMSATQETKDKHRYA